MCGQDRMTRVSKIQRNVFLFKKIKKIGRLRAAFIAFDIAMVLLIFALSGQTDAGKSERAAAVELMGESVSAGVRTSKNNESPESVELPDSNESSGSNEALKLNESQKNGEMKKVALTFDDGPHYAYTKILLDGLKERGVVATFFVTGEHAELHPDLIKRMHDEGHLVGNHTYSHMQLRNNNHEEYGEELTLTNKILEEIIGEEVIFVRPPYGSWDKKFEEELNLIPVLWTVDPLDWCSSDAACIVQNTMCEVQENDIILMHDYYETSVTAALEIVDELQEDGFTFVTVEEILFD